MTSISLSMPWRPPWLSQYAWSRNRDCSSFSLSFLLPSTDMTSSGSLQTHKKGHEKKQSSWVKLQHTKVWDRWRWWVRPSHPFQQRAFQLIKLFFLFCVSATKQPLNSHTTAIYGRDGRVKDAAQRQNDPPCVSQLLYSMRVFTHWQWNQ